ncbi:MAG: phosphotransferase enzyme family protein [Candidatus Hodarchaeales archaeon]|jgi:Ser/Thr protein kinase RdoA (MazF antagonist)
MEYEDQLQPKNELLEMISRQFGIFSELNLLIEADNNFIYEFHQDGKEFILRGGTRHTEELVQAEIEWILFIDKEKVKVSIPIRSTNGKYLEQVNHNGKTFNVVVFEKAPGQKVDLKNPEEWNEKFWENMGKVLGKLHHASIQYNQSEPKFRRPMYYEDEYIELLSILDPKQDEKIIQKVKSMIKQFDLLSKEPTDFGVIHYDLHTGNFHKNGDDIIIFDWDDSHYFFFMYDLAATFHETIWNNPLDKRQEFANSFIPAVWKGYSTVYPLDRKWLSLLPQFFKWREFQIYVYTTKECTNSNISEKERIFFTDCTTEFRDWLVNDTQIVEIPPDIKKWFPPNKSSNFS